MPTGNPLVLPLLFMTAPLASGLQWLPSPIYSTLSPWSNLYNNAPYNPPRPLYEMSPYYSPAASLARQLDMMRQIDNNLNPAASLARQLDMMRQVDDTMGALLALTSDTLTPALAAPTWTKEGDDVKMTFAVPQGIELKAALDPTGKVITLSGEGKDTRGTEWSYSRTMSLPFKVANTDAIAMESADDQTQTCLTIKVPSSAALPQPEPRRITIKKAEPEVKKVEAAEPVAQEQHN